MGIGFGVGCRIKDQAFGFEVSKVVVVDLAVFQSKYSFLHGIWCFTTQGTYQLCPELL